MKRIAIFIAMMLALCAAGCSARQAAPQQTPEAATEKGYVTAFGTVQCAESLALVLPMEIELQEVYVRDSQAIPPHTPVFKIDMALLRLEKERTDHQLAALMAEQENDRLQIDQAKLDLAKLQAAAKRMDVDKLLGILNKLANAGSRTRRDPYEAKLLSYLEQIGSVGRYHSLLALTADRRNVYDNARPVLLELKEQLVQSSQTQQNSLLVLQQLLHQAQADALPLSQKADIIKAIYGGQPICGVGSFNAQGVLTTADRPLLLAGALQQAGQPIAAGTPVAVFDSLDTIEVIINIEEQLISRVSVGADVQLSPLYDKSVVWLGTVKSVSDRAIAINGETVIQVTVAAEGMTLGPGYNVVAKILPPAK